MKLGTAEVLITPDSPIGLPLGGYVDRKQLCTGVHDDVYARIFYFETENSQSSQKQLFLVSLDLIGVSSVILDHYRHYFAKKLNVPFENIIFASIHTHSSFETMGIMGVGYLPGLLISRLNTRIINRMMQKVFGGLRQARQNLVTVLMGIKKVIPTEQLGFERHLPIQKPPIALTIIKFIEAEPTLTESEPSEKTKAILLNFGVHPTILSPTNSLISAEWPGALINDLHTKLNPETFIAFFQGAEGNIGPRIPGTNEPMLVNPKKEIPNAYGKITGFEAVNKFGKYLAEAVDNTLPTIECYPFDFIKSIEHPMQVPVRQIKLGNSLKNQLRYLRDSIIKKFLVILFRTLNSTILGLENIHGWHNETYAHVVQLGEIKLILSPGEMFYEYGEKLMRYGGDQSYSTSIIIGLANNYAYYLYPVNQICSE